QANPDPNTCLGVFGLSLYTTERDLREVFSRYGPLSGVNVVYDQRTGRSRGFAFVYFERIDDSKEAMEHANGMELDGRRIRVDYSITKRAHTPTPGIYMGRPTHSGGGGGGGGGGACRRRDSYYDRGYDRGYDRYEEYDYRYRRRSPSPYYSRYRSRSRSRSYSPNLVRAASHRGPHEGGRPARTGPPLDATEIIARHGVAAPVDPGHWAAIALHMAPVRSKAPYRRSMPRSDPHVDCLRCLGEAHISNRCKICKSFKPRTKRERDVRLWAILIESALTLTPVRRSELAQGTVVSLRSDPLVPSTSQHRSSSTGHAKKARKTPSQWHQSKPRTEARPILGSP
ncbi:Transformer-2 protein like protein alpha, partial [Chelonia mydas]